MSTNTRTGFITMTTNTRTGFIIRIVSGLDLDGLYISASPYFSGVDTPKNPEDATSVFSTKEAASESLERLANINPGLTLEVVKITTTTTVSPA